MKKILLAIILLISPIILFSQSFDIETSQGTKTLTIPEGKTIEDVLVDIAELYWEERYDLEETQDELDKVLHDIEYYKEVVDRYVEQVNELEDERDKLQVQYESVINFPQIFTQIGVRAGYAPVLKEPYAGIEVSILINKRLGVSVEASYPFRIGAGISIPLFD